MNLGANSIPADLYFLAIAVVANGVLILHILNNNVLNRTERIWFTITTGILTMADILELICWSEKFAASHRGLYSFLILLEFAIIPTVSPTKCFAYGERSMGYITLGLCAIFVAAELALYFGGNLFSLDANGNYVEGTYIGATTLIILLFTVLDAFILYLVGNNFHAKDKATLIGIMIFTVFFLMFDFITDSTSVTLPCYTISMALMYLHYYELKQRQLQEKLQQATMETVQVLVDAIDAKDEYTRGHSSRVAEYSKILAERLGYQGDKLGRLFFAASMHDVGKIGIPDSVLNKAGRLTDVEYNIMKEHTKRGSKIAKEITFLPEVYDASRHHHERYDGHGYPDGLAGGDIPEIARIIAVADCYDAMNSDRIYRKALPREVIRQELEKGIGVQLDPDYARLFLELMDQGVLDKVSDPGRADMKSAPQDDDFSKFTKDIMQLFSLKQEFLGEWDDSFEDWEKLKGYTAKITDQYQVEYEMAVISIRPIDESRTTSDQLESALAVMQAAAEKTIKEEDVCARISKHQLVLVLRKDSVKDLTTTMMDILIYFYKIFASEPFVIDCHKL